LKKAGCVTYVANHGQEALEFLKKTDFWSSAPTDLSTTESSPIILDVVLMDIEMPIMDGLACTRRIRELQTSREIGRHIPIIAVSANARSEQMAEAREAGIDDSIAKPFRFRELIPKIEALVKGEGPAVVLTTSTGLA
jgi:CheY-like chemotaxis protein